MCVLFQPCLEDQIHQLSIKYISLKVVILYLNEIIINDNVFYFGPKFGDRITI